MMTARPHAKPLANPLANPRTTMPSARRLRSASASPPRPRASEWTVTHDEALDRGMGAIGLQPTTVQREALRGYARLLLKWNRTYNLLGSDDPDTALESHLLDALAVTPALGRWLPGDDAPLVDVGSGGGLPGIPLAIMRPQLPVILVEPVGKKAAFLRQAIAECRLGQVAVREARLQASSAAELLGDRAGAIVTIHFICRAFTSLTGFAQACAPMASHDSFVMAMKAARVQDELEALRATVPQVNVLAVEPISIPGQDVQRSLVVMQPARRDVTAPATTTSGA